MKEKLWQWYETFIVDRPRTVLLVLLALFIAIASYTENFRLDASADSLVLEDDADLKFYRLMNRRYGSDNFLAITFKPSATKEIFEPATLKQLRALSDEISALPGIKTTLSILDVPLLQSPTIHLTELSEQVRTLETEGVDLALAKREFQNSPLYKDLLLSRDGTTTMLLAYLEKDLKYQSLLAERENLRELKHSGAAYSSATLEKTEQAFKDYQIIHTKNQRNTTLEIRQLISKYKEDNQIFLGGVAMIITDMISMIQSDLIIFGAAIFLFLVLMLSIIFRSLRWVSLALLCALLSAFAMLGILGWLDWRVTVISSNFVALLLIISISMTIHLIVRFRELQSRHPEATTSKLLKRTIRFMFEPCVYTALTTIVAFISLFVSGIRPVIDFGHIMTIGIVFAFFLIFTLFPSFLGVLKKSTSHHHHDFTQKITNTLANVTLRHHPAIVIIALIAALLSVIGISRLQVENRFIDYFSEDTEIYQGMLEIDQKLGGTTPFDVIVKADISETSTNDSAATDDLLGDYLADEQSVMNYWLSPSKIKEIEQLHNYFDSQTEIGKVMSLATLTQLAKILNKGQPLGDFELAFLEKLLPNHIKKILYSPYISEDGNEIRLSMRVIDSDKNLKRKELIEQTQQKMNELGYRDNQFRLSGMLVLYNNMLQSLYKSQILTLGMVLLSILAMFIILFRSFTFAVIAIIPNVLASIFVLGLMGWREIPLDMMTITIAAISIGIAVDNTIHYIIRFKRELPADYDYRAAIKRCHNSIGRAMYYTSITVIVGFSILSLSNFIPTIYFGLLTGLAMLTAFLASLTLLPALLLVFKPEVQRREVELQQ